MVDTRDLYYEVDGIVTVVISTIVNKIILS